MRNESEFEQCLERQGTNVKCDPVRKTLRKNSENFCSRHLVEAEAEVKFMNEMGHVVEE